MRSHSSSLSWPLGSLEKRSAPIVAWLALGLAPVLSAVSITDLPRLGGIYYLGWLLLGAALLRLDPEFIRRLHFAMGWIFLVVPWMSWPGDWNENHAAGVLLFFFPVQLAESFIRGSRRGRLVAGVAAAASALSLVAWGSRGAGAAALLATAWVALAASKRPGRELTRARRWGAALIALAGGGLLVGFVRRPWIESLLLEGQLKGLTLEHALSGRLDIWWRSWTAFRDFPNGLGLGTVPRVLNELYPDPTSQVTHAHQMVLQTGLELGIFGLLALGGLIVSAFVSGWTQQPFAPTRDQRLRSAGSTAALGASLIFGIADCLPLSRFSGFGLWTLLALKLREEKDRPDKAASTWWLNALLLSAFVPLFVGSAAPEAVNVVLKRPEEAAAMARRLEKSDSAGPRQLWLSGLLYHRSEDRGSRDRVWARLLHSGSPRIPLLAAVVGETSPELAETAVRLHPERCEAWWWRAESRPRSEIREQIEDYRRGLLLCPEKGIAWQRSAVLLISQSRRETAWSETALSETALSATALSAAALAAYAQSCIHGDPGANGCWNGGRLAETLGRPQAAIDLYRRSRLPDALRRADQVEAELKKAATTP